MAEDPVEASRLMMRHVHESLTSALGDRERPTTQPGEHPYRWVIEGGFWEKGKPSVFVYEDEERVPFAELAVMQQFEFDYVNCLRARRQIIDETEFQALVSEATAWLNPSSRTN